MSRVLLKRILYSGAASASLGSLYYTFLYQKTKNMMPSYQATFSVPMHCDSCTKGISAALSKVDGIQETSFNLPSQLLTTIGTTSPSTIISAVQSTGRTCILRGSGAVNSAAVCILETPPPSTPLLKPEPSPVRGLARLIELSERITLLDITLTGLPKGTYVASIRQTGDISAGVQSMGGTFTGIEGDRKGELGTLKVDQSGRGALVGEVDWRVWEMVGRGIMVQKSDNEADAPTAEVSSAQRSPKRDEVVMGVVARSAGVWENEKVVCGCSGKTVWEEREEQVSRGML